MESRSSGIHSPKSFLRSILNNHLPYLPRSLVYLIPLLVLLLLLYLPKQWLFSNSGSCTLECCAPASSPPAASPSSPPPFFLTTSPPLKYSKFSPSEKYLRWASDNDAWEGVSHRIHSWECALGEAVVLNRTFIFPSVFFILPSHNHGIPSAAKDIRLYINMKHLLRHVRLIEEDYFWKQMEEYERDHQDGPELTNLEVNGTMNLNTTQLSNEYRDEFLISRLLGSVFMYEKCYDRVFKEDGSNWVRRNDSEFSPSTIRYSPSLVKISSSIKRFLGSNYNAVHIRRGDKITQSRGDGEGLMHPTLDRDTRPEQLMRMLPKWYPRGSTIYLATNEEMPHFFDPLEDLYLISSLSNYRHLWSEGSEWWNISKHFIHPEDPAPFDGMMEGIVDYRVMGGASLLVETFGMLSPGNRHFVTTEEIAAWNASFVEMRN